MSRGFRILIGRLPTLPHTCACSTIGAARLNYRVRDGNGWDPRAKITQSRLELGWNLDIDGQRHIFRVVSAFALLARLLRFVLQSVFSKFYGQAERAISNGKLNVLLRLHIRPINVVVFHGPY